MRSFPKNKGFTLVELTVTVLVVAIVAIPVSMLIRRQFETAMESGDYVSAMNLARLEMEKVNNMAYAIIGNDSQIQDGYQIDRTVAYARGDAFSLESVKRIRVGVKKAGSTSEIYHLVTYKAKNISYGL